MPAPRPAAPAGADRPSPVNPAGPRPRLVGLEQRLLGRLRARSFAPRSILLVGFSGGVDSLALAAALGRVASVAGVEPLLAHVDHGLRPESRTEQDRAERLAARLGLPFRRLALPVHPAAAHPGVGIEEAARRERYRALAALCRETGAIALVLGHQRDDQAETVLLHLLRGAGLAGARGMAEWSERSVPWWDAAADRVAIGVWRPLLEESRNDLAAYVAGRGLAPIPDPTNDDREFRRNLVRHAVLPRLEEVFPGAAAALARYGRLVGADDDALDAWAHRVLAKGAAADGSLDLAALEDEPAAVARRTIRAWLAAASRGTLDATAERVEALLGRATRRAGGRIEVGDGWTVVVTAGRLRLDSGEEE